MKIASRCLCIVLLISPLVLSAADKEKSTKEAKLTLEDVIFDPSYLQQALGANTLVVPEKDRAVLTPALSSALVKAGITTKSRVFLLPDGATPPTLRWSIPYSYPRSLRQGHQQGAAKFLVLVGSDGAVKTLYCFDSTERLFALGAALAIVKWKYAPATINGTAVPVIMEHNAEFRGDGYDEKIKFGSERDPKEMAPLNSGSSSAPK